MSAPARELQLGRVSTVGALVEALRTRILDGELPGGTRLREQELTASYGVARHSVRAALRELAGTGLIRVEPHRGATVTLLQSPDVQGLYVLRGILEVGAAKIALERGGGRLPHGVHAAASAFAALCCSRDEPAWSSVVVAHNALHEAIVAASRVPRVIQAHAGLSAELQLFLVQSRPHYTLRGLATDHVGLVVALERDGPEALAEHIRLSTQALIGGDPGPGPEQS
ncbi:MAG: GntR family transcriptional regulator [Solirubrobacterales bacterium]|nr:GntR family transcriptional regulator [Solirubrobacterales bacterium]